jgi:hypothetical protein
VFAKLVFSIEHGGKLSESEEGEGEFIVTSGQTTMTLETAPEVFDTMPTKGGGRTDRLTPRFRWPVKLLET